MLELGPNAKTTAQRRVVPRFAWALLASLLLHAALIGDLARLRWPAAESLVSLSALEVSFRDVPTIDKRASAIIAEPMSPQASARERKPPPAPPAADVAASPSPMPAADAQPPHEDIISADLAEPAPAPALPEATEAAAPPPPAVAETANPDLPPRGALTYRFYWGRSRWLAGQAVHQWLVQGRRYTLSSYIQTTGLFWLLRPLQLLETAKGTLVGNRLRPEMFSTQLGADVVLVASFNWEKNYFRWFDHSGSARQELPPDAYDKISFLFQLFLHRESHGLSSAHISMGRRLDPYTVANLGIEEVDIDGTPHPAAHFRTTASAIDTGVIDVWLSSAHGIPVKMTYTTGDGEYFEQLIEPDSLPGARPPADPPDPLRGMRG